MFKVIGLLAALLTSTGIGNFALQSESDSAEATRLAALDPTLPGRKGCRGIDAQGQALDQRLQLAAGMPLPLSMQAGARSLPLYSSIPTSDITATGISGEGRAYFDQGVALLYGFNHAAAVRSFRKARAFEPECAMCWWGEAYANGLNINAGMSEEQNRMAIFAAKQAQRLSADASDMEKALIAAQLARFPDDLAADRAALERNYSAMMMKVA
ncbi:MAG TPA: hypothetical protein VK839_08835, partial [Erythrobacter sp.]|nr:hypothetical protein [Erythrobacter sp.]